MDRIPDNILIQPLPEVYLTGDVENFSDFELCQAAMIAETFIRMNHPSVPKNFFDQSNPLNYGNICVMIKNRLNAQATYEGMMEYAIQQGWAE
jgi:hypothetical protein